MSRVKITYIRNQLITLEYFECSLKRLKHAETSMFRHPLMASCEGKWTGIGNLKLRTRVHRGTGIIV
jgi:hypothetical protein